MPGANLQQHQVVKRGGYELVLYPGFASRAVMHHADGSEVELYRQANPFKLLSGQTEPDTRHTIHLKGGSAGRDITLDVNDPEHRIARIRVELYPGPRSGFSTMSDDEPGENDELEIINKAKNCPPDC